MRPLQVARGGRPVEVPVRVEQVEHAPLDDVAGDAGREVGTGAGPVGGLVDRAAGAAHPVEDARPGRGPARRARSGRQSSPWPGLRQVEAEATASARADLRTTASCGARSAMLRGHGGRSSAPRLTGVRRRSASSRGLAVGSGRDGARCGVARTAVGVGMVGSSTRAAIPVVDGRDRRGRSTASSADPGAASCRRRGLGRPAGCRSHRVADRVDDRAVVDVGQSAAGLRRVMDHVFPDWRRCRSSRVRPGRTG